MVLYVYITGETHFVTTRPLELVYCIVYFMLSLINLLKM
jgi:hypothetical protein